MKNIIKLVIPILFIGLPFLCKAQFSLALLTAPISKTTTTKILLPIGIEFKLSDSLSLAVEYGIPFKDIATKQLKAKAFSLRIELRKYKLALTKRKFRQYLAFNIYYLPEFYSLKNIVFSKTCKVYPVSSLAGCVLCVRLLFLSE